MNWRMTFQCRAKLTRKGYRRLDWIRRKLNRHYNSCLQERRDAWEKDKKRVSAYDQMKSLTQNARRTRMVWAHSQSLRNAE